MLKAVPAIAFAIAAIAAPSVARGSHRAKNIPVVTVHASEFAFASPATIAAGQVTFRLVNDGKQLHHVTVMRLEKGTTFAEFAKALKANKLDPTSLTAMGGPNAALPGTTIDATLTLEPGNYVLACFIPSPGEETPHAMKGMYKSLVVSAAGGVQQAGSATAPAPVPDTHLVLKDYTFTLSKPLTAGKHTIHVMNEAAQDHEVILVRLAPGKHASDFASWAMTGMKGPPPAAPMAGMAALSRDRSGIFTENFTPGRYGLICFVNDAKDHKPHSEHGMTSEFTIAAK
jgi:uncharacterized cupredoxin-like copper-binding protein